MRRASLYAARRAANLPSPLDYYVALPGDCLEVDLHILDVEISDFDSCRKKKILPPGTKRGASF